jgi:hypothetical protein
MIRSPGQSTFAEHFPGDKGNPAFNPEFAENPFMNSSHSRRIFLPEAPRERTGRFSCSFQSCLLECNERYLSLSRVDEKPSPGSFLYLVVSDSGPGMNEETRAHLFEPFCTTRFMGRGLGMSVVLGIVRVHGRAILLESEAGDRRPGAVPGARGCVAFTLAFHVFQG